MNEASIDYLCRLCLNKSYFYSNIYCGQSSDCDPLYETINYVFDLQISMDDGLPEYVCHQCLSMVHDFERYKKSVQKATLELLRIKRKMNENSVCVKTEIHHNHRNSCKSSPEHITAQDQDNNTALAKEDEMDVGDSSSAPQAGFHNWTVSSEYESSIKQEVDADETANDKEVNQNETETEAFEYALDIHGEIMMANSEKNGSHSPAVSLRNSVYNCVRNHCEPESLTKEQSEDLQRSCSRLKSALERAMRGEGVDGSSTSGKLYEEASSRRTNTSEASSVPNGRKFYTCDTCRRCFQRKAELVKHVVTHSDERPYPCGICGRRFKRIDVRKLHELRHIERDSTEKSKEGRFKCELCGKQYALKDSLRKHAIIHTLPFSCVTCGKQFYQSATLKQHTRIHTGEKPFPCSVCEKSFRKKSDLRQHLVSHSDERPFACGTCDMRFKTKNCRNKHELFHLKERK